MNGQQLTDKIVIDQFGYRTSAEKNAILRNPITGADASATYVPSSNFAVVNALTSTPVFTGSPTIWNNGSEDPSSGDKAWTFNFTSLTAPGSYYILDVDNQVKSFTFEIKDDIYSEILKQAVRAFYYQRSGFEKQAQYAGAKWTDDASHLGPLQDKNCRKWDEPTNAATELDVHGGWYDAGDLNKYTSWTSDYIIELLRAYRENPSVWTDDYNIPESGNGTPDIIDETKWGIDHLLRLQLNDGSLISVISADGASPPSAATGASLYGNVNTSATLSAAGAYALSALVFKSLGENTYSDTLKNRAIKAWNWAVANPAVVWKNNDAASGTTGIAAGQQEVDDYGRLVYKLRAANYLFELTNDIEYQTYFDANYNQIRLFQWTFAYPFGSEDQDAVLEYLKNNNGTISVQNAIRTTFEVAMNKTDNFSAIENSTDPYRAHLKDYTWGSNKHKCSVGLMFWEVDYYDINPSKSQLGRTASEDYIHYIHGVNPMNICYLTNMSAYGAENSANQIYHTWFKNESIWDDAKKSANGPAPGIVPGGPNPSYKVDACCPSGCGSSANNAKCTAVDLSAILNQPDQKSYLDFNHNWPLNSWEVTENSMGYQAEYIRLLSKFVSSGTITGKEKSAQPNSSFTIYPNPAQSEAFVKNWDGSPIYIRDANNKLIEIITDTPNLNLSSLSAGVYFIQIGNNTAKLIKE